MTSISGISGSTSMIQQMMQQMFQKADADGDGSLTLEESKAGGPQGPNGAQAPAGAPDISQIFAKIDANGDGSLSEDEFSTGFQKMHDEAKTALLNAQEQSRSSFMDELFKKADTDGDGQLSQAEFEAAAPKGPPPGPPPGSTASSESSSTDQQSTALLEMLKKATELYENLLGQNYTQQAEVQTQSVIA